MSRSSHRITFLIIAVLCLSFLLRAWGLAYGLPYVEFFTADGEHYVADAVNIASTRNFNPGWFGHPGSTVIYSLAVFFGVANRIGMTLGLLNDYVGFLFAGNPAPFYMVGRLFASFAALLAIAVTYRIGKFVGGERVGLFAALLLAISPLHLFISRLARTDAPVVFFSVVSVWGALRVLQKPSWKNYLLAGIGAGLAMSTKYYGVVAIMSLPAAHFLRMRAHDHCYEKATWGKLLVAGLSVGLAFALTSPFAILEWRTTVENLLNEGRATHLGADGFSPVGNLVWYGGQVLPAALGLFAALGVLLGIVRLMKTDLKKMLVFSSSLLCFLALISSQNLHWDRWLTPVLPVLAVLSAFGLDLILQRLSSLKTLGVRKTRIMIFLLGGLFFLQPLSKAVLESYDRTLPDTRLLTGSWIQTNLPHGSRIAHEGYTAPLDAEKFAPWFNFALSRQPVSLYCEQGFEYIILSSEIQRRYDAEPERYQDNQAFYAFLAEHAPVVYQAVPERGRVVGPTVTVYSLLNCNQWLP